MFILRIYIIPISCQCLKFFFWKVAHCHTFYLMIHLSVNAWASAANEYAEVHDHIGSSLVKLEEV